MLKIAKWYNNFQAPSVLMIDDLSDAYIDVYPESYKNDWGYLCSAKGSSFDFLNKELLNKFPHIKITFFTPYLKHNVINENSEFKYKKFAVGDRIEFINFLKKLKKLGYEIAHHGSNHGKYIDNSKTTTVNNWIHEWALFDNVKKGIETTLKGVDIFKNHDVSINGGKYCGYIIRDNSQEIIDKCDFLYWCDKPSYNIGEYDESFFGKNNIISFPTNYPGNSFVRLTYLSGDKKKDRKKKILKYFQSIYNVYAYTKLYILYKNQHIISIQEHYSPATTTGTVQSANIVTDINSLNKIFDFLQDKSIWYASCQTIAEYVYVRENSKIEMSGNKVRVNFSNKRKLTNSRISLKDKQPFKLISDNEVFSAIKNNGMYVVNTQVKNGINEYIIAK